MRSTEIGQKFSNGSRGQLAAAIAVELIEMRRQEGGGLKRAMHEVAAETGISYWTLERWWKCRRAETCGGCLVGTWRKLLTVYQLECARQVRAYQQKLDKAKELGGDETDQTLVRTANLVAGDLSQS